MSAPINTPSIAPIIPYLLPPNFLAPRAITMLSIKVKSKERMKRIINMVGVIIRNFPIIATIKTPMNTNHTPGRVRNVSITPVIDSNAANIYKIISSISVPY